MMCEAILSSVFLRSFFLFKGKQEYPNTISSTGSEAPVTRNHILTKGTFSRAKLVIWQDVRKPSLQGKRLQCQAGTIRCLILKHPH